MENNSPFTIMGVGGAGCRVIGKLRQTPGAQKVRLLAADTDREGLAAAGIDSQNTLLAGEMWRGGRGCGGNIADGKCAMGRARNEISNLISGSKMLLVTAALGGGTASGGISVVLAEAARLHIPAVALLTLPFSCEGNQRKRQAQQALDEDIYSVSDAVIALPNDLLFSSSVLPSTTPLKEAFDMADEQIARTALALSELLCAGNLLNADFTSFSNLLKRKKSRCALGVGIARSEDGARRPEIAFEEMLSSPLLGGSSKLLNADAVLFSLLGGPELSIGDVQAIFTLGEKFIRREALLLTAASTAPEWQGMIQFTALAVNFDKQEELPVPPAGKKSRQMTAVTDSLFSAPVEQPALPFDHVSNGIMESTQKVMWGGEDLDIPTYLRREIVIDTGKRLKK